MSTELIVVEPGEHGLSLLQFLKGKLSHSGKTIKKAIDANGCFINGRVERFSSFKVKQGDMVAISMERARRKGVHDFPILYEDETLKAVYKSPFISCDETHLLHRLDKETSGVLLISQDQSYFDLFRRREMNKCYIAIIEGTPEKPHGIIKFPIGIKKMYDGHKVMHVDPEGKEAITEYYFIKKMNGFSVLALFPKTGRTHQLRVHLSALGYPILGDYDYAKSFSLTSPRMLLHAYRVEFFHPHKKEKMSVTAPLPDDFLPFIKEEEVRSFLGSLQKRVI